MIMNILDILELIERKYGILGTIFGIALIVLSTIIAIISLKIVLNAWFEVLNIICIKFFNFKLF